MNSMVLVPSALHQHIDLIHDIWLMIYMISYIYIYIYMYSMYVYYSIIASYLGSSITAWAMTNIVLELLQATAPAEQGSGESSTALDGLLSPATTFAAIGPVAAAPATAPVIYSSYRCTPQD